MDTNIIESNLLKFELLKETIESRSIAYIYGPSGIGKTFLALKALSEDKSILHAHINCFEILTPSQLYISILTKLGDALRISKLRRESAHVPSLLGVGDFFELYQTISETGHKRGFRKVYIVLDRLENFHKTNMIDQLITLIGAGIHLICISTGDTLEYLSEIKSCRYKNIIFDNLCMIQLNSWTKKELVEQICQDEMTEIEPDLYKVFVNNVVNVLYDKYTKDFKILRTFCKSNYPHFHQDYVDKSKEVAAMKKRKSTFDTAKMSALSSFLESIHHMIKQKDMWDYDHQLLERQVVICKSAMIIAAYCAAYTKPSDDKRNFIKFQKRRVSERKQTTDLVAVSRPFSLERLLHIFKGILRSLGGSGNDDVDIELPHTVMGDVRELEDKNIIKAQTRDTFDSTTRYKIADFVERDYVDRLAEQIKFSLDHIYGLKGVNT